MDMKNKWVEFRTKENGAKRGRIVIEEGIKMGVFVEGRGLGEPGQLIWLDKNSKDYKFIDKADIKTAANRMVR